MRTSDTTSFRLLIVLAGASLLLGSRTPPPQDPEAAEKRLKDLETARAALEKRNAETEKKTQELAGRLKDVEQARAAHEKRLADLAGQVEAARAGFEKRMTDVEKNAQELAGRLKEAERARQDLLAQVRELQGVRTSLEKRLVEAEKGSLQAADRLKQIETLGASTEARVAEGEKRTQEAANRLKEIQVARAALEARVAEIDRARQEMAGPLRELQTAWAALERKLAESDSSRRDLLAPLRTLEAARALMEQRLERLEASQGGFVDRLAAAEAADDKDRGEARAVRADVQRVKLALLSAGGNGVDPETRPAWTKPIQDHFAYLGVVYEFVKGEGMRLVRVARKTPADEADLNRGDIVVRVNGVPVKSTGVTASRTPIEKWWDAPQQFPNFVLSHVPGDTVRLEYRRDGVVDWVSVRLACGRCGGSCSLYR